MNRILSSITGFICGAFLLQQGNALLANDDPWLLFRNAQSVVAGEVTQILQEERDLLYHLTGATPGNLNEGSTVIWWREPEGAGTEGIGAQTGTRGAWLVATETDELFPVQVATLLPRGFLRMNDLSQVKDLNLLLDEIPQPEAALRLLHSPDTAIRRVAIGWWSRSGLNITDEQRTEIEHVFSHEADPGCQRSFLNLYLQNKWIYTGAGISELIPYSEDGTVSWLTLRYLEKHGNTRQRARLISAWIVSNDTEKEKIALAFRDLKMREAHPWLLKEIAENGGRLRLTCIEVLAATGDSTSENVIQSLLESDCNSTRTAVMKGLARSNNARGFKILNSAFQKLHVNDPIFQRAQSLKKSPRGTALRSGE